MMANSQLRAPPTPPYSVASPTPSIISTAGRSFNLPTPRTRQLKPGSQKEIALISYLDNQILKITRRYGKKFSQEGLENDDTPGYTTYDEFVADAEPLVDVVWISATPSIQIPYFLQLAGLACSYLQAFPFTASVFHLTNKIDQGFAGILRPGHSGSPSTALPYNANMTEKVRIRSLIGETRVAAVNAATSGGYASSVQDLSEMDTDEEPETMDELEDEDEGEDSQNMSLSMALSKVYCRTLEILGDSLVKNAPPKAPNDDVPMT